jgi:hypothetical protein
MTVAARDSSEIGFIGAISGRRGAYAGGDEFDHLVFAQFEDLA